MIGSSVDFGWSCVDPDGDPLVFDIRLGTQNPPTVTIGSGLANRSYSLQGLETGKKYYWQVVAKDPFGKSTTGPVWSFECKIPYAVEFDAASRLVVSPSDELNLSSGNLTVEAWVRPADVSRFRWIVAKGDDNTRNDYVLGIDDGHFRFIVNGPALPQTPANDITSTYVVPTGSWTHVAGVVDRSTNQMRIYVNGQLDKSATLKTSVLLRSEAVYIGSRTSADYFAGQIDELRLWSVARTQLEIGSGNKTHIAAAVPGLVACWGFDEGSGDQAYNASSSSLTAVFDGNVRWVQSTSPVR